jgi:hypothetical protein
MITFYCGLNNQTWYHHPVATGPYTCIAPVYDRSLRTKAVNRVTVPLDTAVLQDSGAFSDGPGRRLNFEEALERQIAHAERFKYADRIAYRASYDLLIDEKWEGGKRHKARWTEQNAEEAVEETVAAARYLSLLSLLGFSSSLSPPAFAKKETLPIFRYSLKTTLHASLLI